MFEMVITILIITLTVAIALVPIWYPKYSLFTWNSNIGLEQLLNPDNERTVTPEDFTLPSDREEAKQYFSVLKKGDKGFSEVNNSILNHTSLNIKPDRYELVHHCPNGGNTLIGEDGNVRKLEQAYIKAENREGESVRIIDSPSFEIERVLQLMRLREWISNQATRRAHYIVTVFAVIWGSISVISIILG